MQNGGCRALACGYAAALLLSTGCGSSSEDPDPALPAPSCTGDSARDYDVTAYALRGTFDWERRTLAATLQLTTRVEAGVRSIELDSRVARLVGVGSGDATLPFRADEVRGTLCVTIARDALRAPKDLTLEVEYEAGTSPGLSVSAGRDGDPVTTRVAFTQGEPNLVAHWMPGNHHPRDRARFSVALDVADRIEVVSNGARVDVTTAGAGRRVIRYAMDQPIPTYTMAFAMGELEAHTSEGEPPLTLWQRRGVPVDVERHLAVLGETMRRLERLLGPYPFEAYAVALLPEYPGAMENSSLTFMAETADQSGFSAGLGAHELAHQWFGDAVTIAGWGDFWIKEGLATLLESESAAVEADALRLHGDRFLFAPRDAIRDRAVDQDPTPEALYTSGPYSRAAWLFTQLRALLGEDEFFTRLRGVIDDYRGSAIGTDEMLDVLAPGLAPTATRARLGALIDAKGAPKLSAVAAERSLLFSLDDPEALLVTPFQVTVVDGAGAGTLTQLEPGATTIDVPPGGYIALDERDVHPDWFTGEIPFLLPSADAARTAFLSRSAAAQESALAHSSLPFTSAAALARDYPQLDSSYARSLALLHGCRARVGSSPPARDAWQTALVSLLRTVDDAGFTPYLGECGSDVAHAAFGEELGALLASPLPTPAEMARLAWIASFDFGAAESLARFAPLATSATSTGLRDTLVARIVHQAAGIYFVPPDASAAPAYAAFFRGVVSTATSTQRIQTVLPGIIGVADETALPGLAAAMGRISLAPAVQRDVVCGAYAVTGGTGEWVTFQSSVGAISELSTAAREVLGSPAACP